VGSDLKTGFLALFDGVVCGDGVSSTGISCAFLRGSGSFSSFPESRTNRLTEAALKELPALVRLVSPGGSDVFMGDVLVDSASSVAILTLRTDVPELGITGRLAFRGDIGVGLAGDEVTLGLMYGLVMP